MKKILGKISQSPVHGLKLLKRRQRLTLRRSLLKVKEALAQEKVETKEMLNTYQRYLQGDADKAQMKQANKQFVDLIKGLGLGVVVVLPFSPITIPLIVKLGQSVGVDVLPSAFAHMVSKDDGQKSEPVEKDSTAHKNEV